MKRLGSPPETGTIHRWVVSCIQHDAAYEAWVYVRQRLAEIKDTKLFESAGFTGWQAYCNSGRLDYKKAQANDLISTSDLRKKLPRMAETLGHWNQWQVMELRKCETDKDAIRVAKKAIAKAKKTKSRVTASLIAEIRDGDAETGKASAKAEKKLDAARLDKHLEKLADLLMTWRTSLENVPGDAWEDVPRDLMIRVTTEAADLTTFLRS